MLASIRILVFGFWTFGMVLSAGAIPRIITTVVGNGVQGFTGDGGGATSASLSSPRGVFVDGGGNLYIADASNHRIRKVDPSGIITTVAGNGRGGFSGDGGAATSASLFFPFDVFADGGGNLYIADGDNHRIRKVDPSGVITTVAGNGSRGFSGDGGAATSTSLFFPAGIFADSGGNLYIADGDNHRSRKVDPSGIITTVAGNGSRGFSEDGGAATAASLFYPHGVVMDGGGNLYIADVNNHRIRKVESVKAPAGYHLSSFADLPAGPSSITVDSVTGDVYYALRGPTSFYRASAADTSTVAGALPGGFFPSAASDIEFNPFLTPAGDLFIPDSEGDVFIVDTSSGTQAVSGCSPIV